MLLYTLLNCYSVDQSPEASFLLIGQRNSIHRLNLATKTMVEPSIANLSSVLAVEYDML